MIDETHRWGPNYDWIEECSVVPIGVLDGIVSRVPSGETIPDPMASMSPKEREEYIEELKDVERKVLMPSGLRL